MNAVTQVFALCGFLVVSAAVFALPFPRLWRGALGQGLAPAVAPAAALF